MFEAKSMLNQVEEKLASVDISYNRLSALKNDIIELDHLIGGQSKAPEHVQQDILDFVSTNTPKADIVSIEDVHLFQDNEFLIYSNQIELEGIYENLINALYDIETNFKNSRVVSSYFYSKKNYKTNQQHLFLKIILQNYEKTN